MSNVLEKIIQHKATEVAARKKAKPLAELKNAVVNSTRSLEMALSNGQADFILECKKASPSKGLIRDNFDLDYILQQYQDFASAISVLTDKKYFQGDFSYLKKASQQVNVPILCKDFFIDVYQVYEARYYGGDAILLMLSVLNDEQYQTLADVAQQLDLDILTEVHDENELNRAIALNAKIIGINNRNLKDLSIDLATTEKLAKQTPKDRLLISESGINDHGDIQRLKSLVNGFLIGSSIMAKDDIRTHCKALVYGKVKVCGITRIEDAKKIDLSGAVYGGFIFYPKSKRNIDVTMAQLIVNTVALKYVGVFVNEDLNTVIEIAKQLQLFAIQLHGDENENYIATLKAAMPTTEIWKAVHVKDSIHLKANPNIKRYLLDKYSADEKGGTGNQFNWQLLKSLECEQIKLTEMILAGGININNIHEAKKIKTDAIDLSSGVETAPGIKCEKKLSQIFKALRV